MLKKRMFTMVVCMLALTLTGLLGTAERSFAQTDYRIIPSPRLTLEAIDPSTGMAKDSFCIGAGTIDVKLSNDTGYGQYVTVVNRDTRGIERRLFTGQLPSGVSYLSRLLGTQLSLTGPAGTETLRIESNDSQWQGAAPQVSYYVRNCGGQGQWPPGPSQAQVIAQVRPYAIEQGKKGTIILQASVGYQQNGAYYFEILNSWGQLWKRVPVTKQPFAPYQVILPVGTKTKPGVLTYTVNLLSDSSYGGEQQLGTTRVSFRVITAGSAQPPYNPGYPGYPSYPGYPGYPSYPTYPGYVPIPYGNTSGYGTSQPYGASYSTYGYGVTSLGSPVTGERQIP